MRSIQRSFVFLAITVSVAACDGLDEKAVVVAGTRGVPAAVAGMIDTPLFGAAIAFGTAHNIKVQKAAADAAAGACATDGCEIQRAKAVGVATLLTSEAQGAALVIKAIDVEGESVVGEERVAPDPATIHTALPQAVERLLAKRFAPSTEPAAAAPAVGESAPVAVDVQPVMVDESEAVKKPVKAAKPAKVRGPKPEAGRQLRRGDALMAMDGNDQIGDPGMLVLSTDTIAWHPGPLNINGRRVSFKLDDVKRVSVERGNLIITVTWGPRYVFDTQQNPGGWREQIEDARFAWTGKPAG